MTVKEQKVEALAILAESLADYDAARAANKAAKTGSKTRFALVEARGRHTATLAVLGRIFGTPKVEAILAELRTSAEPTRAETPAEPAPKPKRQRKSTAVEPELVAA